MIMRIDDIQYNTIRECVYEIFERDKVEVTHNKYNLEVE